MFSPRYIKENGLIRQFSFIPSCSQRVAVEAAGNCENGLYCSHLLRRIKDNKRVENMLMDVNSGKYVNESK